jgi:hypothetical protein
MLEWAKVADPGAENFFLSGALAFRAAGASDGYIRMMGRWASLFSSLHHQAPSPHAHDFILKIHTSENVFTDV